MVNARGTANQAEAFGRASDEPRRKFPEAYKIGRTRADVSCKLDEPGLATGWQVGDALRAVPS